MTYPVVGWSVIRTWPLFENANSWFGDASVMKPRNTVHLKMGQRPETAAGTQTVATLLVKQLLPNMP